jgi:hypothetical protein
VADPATFGTAPYVSSRGRSEDTTRSATWQGSLFKDHLVLTGGLRKDFYRTRNSNSTAPDPSTGFYTNSALNIWGPWTEARGNTRMFSAVVYPLRSRVLGFSYSRSSSFLPQPQAVDLFGNVLPNTFGRGQDVGGFVNLLQDKLVLSIKFYKTNVENDRTSNSTLGTRIARLEAGTFIPGTSADRQSLYYWAQQQTGSNAAAAAAITQFPQGFQNALAANNSGAAIRGTSNTQGKGVEFEASYNPTYNWNLKFNATRTQATQTSIENDLQAYIDLRMPYWLSVRDAAGNQWWTSTAYATQSAQAFYQSAILIPLKLDQALLGKSNPQVKEWTWRLLSTYRFTRGKLNGFSVGGAARWDDKSVIGYYGTAPDPDGIVRGLDVNRPVYDPAHYQFDAWLAYSRKIWRDIRAKIQLNVNNMFENGGLRAVAVNPDGQPYNWRIINPRQFVLTATFDF